MMVREPRQGGSLPRATFVVVLLAVLATAGAAAAGGAAASDGGNVTIIQNGGALEIRVDTAALRGDDSEIDVTVADHPVDDTLVENDSDPYVYAVDLSEEFDGTDLSSADVNVTLPNGETHAETLDLRYVAFGGDARFDEETGELSLGIDERVGVADGPVELEISPEESDETFTLSGSVVNDSVRIERDDVFTDLALSGGNFTIEGGTEWLAYATTETYNLREISPDLTADRTGDTVAASHPLLFEGTEYVVTITVETKEGDLLTTRRVAAGDGSLSVEVPPVRNATVRITHEGVDLGTSTVYVDEFKPVEAALSDDGRNVTVPGLEVDDGEDTFDYVYIRWEDNSTESYDEFVLEDVAYEDGKVLFGASGYELGNGSYDLLLVSDRGELSEEVIVAAVRKDGNESGIGPVNLDDGNSRNLFSLASITDRVDDLSIAQIAALTATVTSLLAVGVVALLLKAPRSAGRGSRTVKMRVDVKVVDETGSVVDEPVLAEFRPTRDSRRMKTSRTGARKRIENGQTIGLSKRRYAVTVPEGRDTELSPMDSTLRVVLTSRKEFIAVEGADGSPLPDARVTISFPNGQSVSRVTDEDGRATVKVPRSVDPAECTVNVEHERYRSETTSLGRTVTLRPRTGRVEIEARIDGSPVPDVDLALEPAETFTSRVYESRTKPADDDGTATFGDVPVGTYEAKLTVDGSDAVDASSATVSVDDGDETSVVLDATFSFSLSPTQRQRLDALHREVSELTPSNRDGAIQYYYGSVLSEVLSTIERLPSAGVTFVRHGVDPGTVTDAVLDAVADAVEYTRRATTKKQNVDLFSACNSLREVRTRWSGDIAVGDLLAFVGDERANHRSRLIDHLETTGEFLSEQRGSVSTITPVRDQYEQIREHATGLSRASPVEQRAHFFVGLQLLVAVEELFDRPELVDRLQETVF